LAPAPARSAVGTLLPPLANATSAAAPEALPEEGPLFPAAPNAAPAPLTARPHDLTAGLIGLQASLAAGGNGSLEMAAGRSPRAPAPSQPVLATDPASPAAASPDPGRADPALAALGLRPSPNALPKPQPNAVQGMADAANDDLASGDGLQLGANPQQPPPASTSVTPAKPMAGQGEIGVGAIKAAATQNVDEPHAGNADLLPFPGDSLELQGEPGEIGRPGAAARTAALQGTPAQQIARASVQGVERLSVQLHPADLGSVEIHVDVARDGQVSAHITAESAETLELLQRDVRMLERGLGESGVRLESGGLSFSLRQEQQPGQGFNPGADQRGGQPGGRSPAPAAETAADAQPARRLSQHLLDISA
jgi:hypothetical protein